MSYYNLILGERKDCSSWLNDESGYLASLELGSLIEQCSAYKSKLNKINLESIISSFEKTGEAFCYDINLKKDYCSLLKKNLKTSQTNSELLIDTILKLFNKNYLLNLINTEFKSSDYSDRDVLELGYRTKYISEKPVFHFLEGVDFVNIVKSFICGVLTKSINFYFIDEEIFEPFLVIFDVFSKFLNKTDFSLCNSIINWRFPKEKIFETLGYAGLTYNLHIDGELYDWSSSLKFWPDERVLKHVYGLNFAVIDGNEINENSVEQIASLLVKDIVYTTEKPLRVIYVIDRDIKSSHLLIESLYDEMLEAVSEIPADLLSLEDKCKIRNLREYARMSQALGEGRLECPADFSFNLILEYNSDFNFVGYGRSVIIKCIQSLDEFKSSLDECEINFGCVALKGFEELKNEIYDILLENGIKQVFKIGDINKMPTMLIDGRHSLKAFMSEIICQEET